MRVKNFGKVAVLVVAAVIIIATGCKKPALNVPAAPQPECGTAWVGLPDTGYITFALKNNVRLAPSSTTVQFTNNNQFLNIVDTLRHTLGKGHLEDMLVFKSRQMKKGTMLSLLIGSKNEPNLPEEFHQMQISALKMFKLELQNLNSIVRSYV